MKVFEFDTQDDQAYVHASSETSQRCKPDPPRSLARGWSPPTFELAGSDEFRSFLPKTDFPTFTIATMVLSARAVGRLGPILRASGEVLPIHIRNDPGEFFLFNVTRVINAVDMQRSRFVRFRDGGIMKCELLVFDPARLPQEAVFFKTTQMGKCTEIFATDSAVKAVEDARLTGSEFRLVWSNE